MLSAKEARATIDAQLEGRFRRDLLIIESAIEKAIAAGNSYVYTPKSDLNNLAKIKQKLSESGYTASEDGSWLKVSW